jgi:hypothetical protein
MRKLNLKELELKLPKIDENYSKILLGGNTYADDAVFGGGCDLIKDKEIADIGWNGPLEHDNSLDLDVSIDGYEYNDGYQDEGQNDGETTEQNNNPSFNVTEYLNNLPESFKNGVESGDFFISGGIELGDSNTRFVDQFYTIIESNSFIAQTIQYIRSLGIDLRFDINDDFPDVSGEHALAHTQSYFSANVIKISFNIDQMNPNDGWENTAHDSSAIISLAETVIHELVHAKYAAEVMKIQQELTPPGVSPNAEAIYNALVAEHSVAFAQMFIELNPSTGQYEYITNSEIRNDREHAYMDTHDSDLLEQTKNELRDDIEELTLHINNIQNNLQTAEQNLNTGLDETANQQLQQIYEDLYYEYTYLILNFGWLID